MGWAEALESMNEALRSVFGVSATYTPTSGSPSEVTVILERLQHLDDRQWNAALQASAYATVFDDEIASPETGATLTIDSVAWTIVKEVNHNGGASKLEIRTDLRPTFGRK